MFDTYNKSLAALLYSKLGGNVNHDFKSVFCELMDNSLDELATIIKSWVEPPDDEFITLYVQDNGNGIKDISNLFNGSSGKKDKMGKKNSGFPDSLVYITGLTGSLEVFSIHNFEYKYFKIPFTDATRLYEIQANIESSQNINYDKIWNELKTKINLVIDRSMVEHKLSTFNITGFERGTIFRFRFKFPNSLTNLLQQKENQNPTPLYTIDNFADYIQTVVQKHKFTLTLGDSEYTIEEKNDFNLTDKYTPTVFNLKLGRKGDEILAETSSNTSVNFNNYYKKSDQNNVNVIKESDFNSQYDAFSVSNDNGVTAYLTCISEEDAKTQQTNFQTSNLETLRGVTIMTMGRILGVSIPFTDLNISSSHLRNYVNIRLLLDINDKSIIQNLTMINKSKLNVSGLCPVVKQFIKDIFNTFIKSNLHVNNIKKAGHTEQFKQYGVLDMNELLDGTLQTPVEESVKEDTAPFDKSIYFGMYNTEKDGFKPVGENKDSIICKFGFTNDTPTTRDNTQKKTHRGWMRLLSVFINDIGGEFIEGTGKIRCENDIYNRLNESRLVISWNKNSKEIFTCKRMHFKEIKDIIYNCCEQYERDFI